MNSRLDEMQAALLRVKLRYLDDEIRRRREIAAYYQKNIKNKKITLPIQKIELEIQNYTNHVWHLFVVRTDERETFQKYLLDNGVQTLIHYPIAPHKQSAYREWNHLSFPVSEKIHDEVLSLPISPVLSIEDAKRVCQIINSY